MLFRSSGPSQAFLFQERLGWPACEFLRKYIALRQREGAFRAGDPTTLVLFMVSPALHLGMARHILGKTMITRADAKVAGELTELVLNGLLLKPQPSAKKRTQKRKQKGL